MRKPTYVLLILVLGTGSFSLFRRQDSLFAGFSASKQDKNVERANKANRAFPVADFNESDSDTSEVGRAKKEKRQRFDAWRLVGSNPPPAWLAETAVSNEGYLDFPALPVNESDIILVATVSNSEAHVSENKRGVFSEFNLVN